MTNNRCHDPDATQMIDRPDVIHKKVDKSVQRGGFLMSFLLFSVGIGLLYGAAWGFIAAGVTMLGLAWTEPQR